MIGVHSCDICGAAVAPFGFAPPPRLGIKVRRPIKTCPAAACREVARGRVASLVARHDPFAATRATRGQVAPPAAADEGQGRLF